MSENITQLLKQLDAETKRELAFLLLREVISEKKRELEAQIDDLNKKLENLENHLVLIENKKSQFIPEYERLTKILNALDQAAENIRERIKLVRDQLKIAQDKYGRYISRLEKALANA